VSGTPVPVALLMLGGPLPLGDALHLVLQVAHRAEALGDVQVDYSLERIRVDSLGGVRCTPKVGTDDPVVSLARLLLKVTTGRSDSPAESLDDLELESLVATAVACEGPGLPGFIDQLQAQVQRFPEASLANLARRARAIPQQVLTGLTPGTGGGSETAQWVIPAAAEPESTPVVETRSHALPPALRDELPLDGHQDEFPDDAHTEETAARQPSLTPSTLAGGQALARDDHWLAEGGDESTTVLLPLESGEVPANIRPGAPRSLTGLDALAETPPTAPAAMAPPVPSSSVRRRPPPPIAAQPVRPAGPVDGEWNPIVVGVGVGVAAMVGLGLIGGFLVLSAM
jgi:hypothetical protein